MSAHSWVRDGRGVLAGGSVGRGGRCVSRWGWRPVVSVVKCVRRGWRPVAGACIREGSRLCLCAGGVRWLSRVNSWGPYVCVVG